MNPLAYFAIELNRQNQEEAERARRLRRQRYGDDEPAAARDRLWAAAIHRFAERSAERSAEATTPERRPKSLSRPIPAR
ncbi:hypothetical protein SAMN05216282_102278 [Cryobacterium psychrotolerans]|uniref:Uncharacterized protein n=1 Tax=Cryobacterium psychrotolerans TaxID=386301 RepID=A0A1G8YSM2_9MICO|nr:hypothetical protein [Cryobacterium psychrotolerans]TFD85650.1 hypothetical protein E3T56_07910 [Cryobacterium psychrotolerans]SDK05859.1 hypothetical protein SAMN05216282_102278 [Cryobacterium psychrotolerans]